MSDIDTTDDRILHALARDGRQSNTALAAEVGLSPSTCLRRVAALEARGVILGYRARINPAALGRGFLAYVTVGLNEHSRAAQEAFERSVARFDEVAECHNITGAVEYLLRVEAADLAAFKLFHTEKLGALKQVNQIVTHVVMSSPKDMRG